MSIIAVPFSAIGASWFFQTGTTASGRLKGFRWHPAYNGPGGAWKGPVTVPALPATFNRVPKAAKPAEPDAAQLAAKVYGAGNHASDNRRVLADLKRQFPLGTRVAWEIEAYRDTHPAATLTGTVTGYWRGCLEVAKDESEWSWRWSCSLTPGRNGLRIIDGEARA